MFEVHFDQSSLNKAESGQIHAIVYFSIDGEAFPDAGWDDFAVVVLTWWTEAVIRLVRGFSRREVLQFMDGPPFAELVPGPDGDVDIRFYGNRAGPALRLTGKSTTTALCRAVLSAATDLTNACRSKGWTSTELDVLEDRVGILRTACA